MRSSILALGRLVCRSLLVWPLVFGCVEDPSAAERDDDARLEGDAVVAADDGRVSIDGAMALGDAAEDGARDGVALDPDAAVPPPPDAAPPPPDVAPLPPDAAPEEEPFSFFVTSLEAMRELSQSEDGFGGNFGGLAGADGICQVIAEGVGVGHKEWRAFLSATEGRDGEPVHAIERIGAGPWYDANGRLVAENIEGLLHDRPDGDLQSVLDLPTEHGMPVSEYGDAHDVPTGSNRQGRLDRDNLASTCNDWTSDDAIGQNQVKCGHTFPRRRPTGRGAHWISDHPLRGCTPGVNLLQNGPGRGDCIGCSGGYGGLYCFALSP